MVIKFITKLILSLLFANIAIAFALEWKNFKIKEKRRNAIAIISFFIITVLIPWLFL